MNKQKIVQKKQILLDEKKSPMNNFRHVFMKEELKLFSTNNKYKKDISSNKCSSAYNDNKKKKSIDLSEANTTYLSSFINKKSNSVKNIHPIRNDYIPLNMIKRKKEKLILNKDFLNLKFKDIFKNENKIFKQKKEIINNKYNLIYSENEKEYRERLQKLNKYKINKGLFIAHDIKVDDTTVKEKKKVNSLIEKIKYMKSIIDYSYPIIISEKNRMKSQKNKHFSFKSFPFYIDIEKKRDNANKKLYKYISNSITITNFKKN